MSVNFYEIHLGCRERLEMVGELPAWRAWENVENVSSPPIDEDHVVEEFVPASSRLIDGPAANGTIETLGLYLVTVFGLKNRGDDNIRTIVNGVLAKFAHGLSFTLPSGARFHVRSGNNEPGPMPGQILPSKANKSRCQITIPWRVHSINSIPTA
jgi:hypothetical protein